MVTGCALHSEQAGVGNWRDRLFSRVIPFVGHSLLFLPGDPAKYPEVLDVAVVLPELMRALHGRFATALVAPDAEQPVHARVGCERWLGVLVTPWCMNLVLMPAVSSELAYDTQSPKRLLDFPAGRLELVILRAGRSRHHRQLLAVLADAGIRGPDRSGGDGGRRHDRPLRARLGRDGTRLARHPGRLHQGPKRRLPARPRRQPPRPAHDEPAVRLALRRRELRRPAPPTAGERAVRTPQGRLDRRGLGPCRPTRAGQRRDPRGARRGPGSRHPVGSPIALRREQDPGRGRAGSFARRPAQQAGALSARPRRPGDRVGNGRRSGAPHRSRPRPARPVEFGAKSHRRPAPRRLA